MSHVFHRSADPIVAVESSGSWITDVSGRRYLDAAGGAIVSTIGHGSARVRKVMSQAAVDYVHPSVFTTNPLEEYAGALARVVPIDDVRVFPTSGGAESVETAVKLARSYHLAMGEGDRSVVISRRQSYHGNTAGALGISGRPLLRDPYEPMLTEPTFVPEVAEYRCSNPSHPHGCASWHAAELEQLITTIGADRIAAFIGEAVGGAATGASVPPNGYWEMISEVCRRHGVLLIVDEIMTGFGRTGHWFGIEMADVRPDIIVSGKGAAGGYWPFGMCMASGQIHAKVLETGGFVHGFTFSHSSMGAAVAHAVLDEMNESGLVGAAADKGERLIGRLREAIGDSAVVGDVRGVGLLVAVELVADQTSKEPFPPSDRTAERVASLAREEGLLVYPSSGCADGVAGDCFLLGPPLTISDEELQMVVDRVSLVIARLIG